MEKAIFRLKTLFCRFANDVVQVFYFKRGRSSTLLTLLSFFQTAGNPLAVLISLNSGALDIDARRTGVTMSERILCVSERACFLGYNAGEAMAGLMEAHVPDAGGIQQGGQGNIQNISLTNNQPIGEILPKLAELIVAVEQADFPYKEEVVQELEKVRTLAEGEQNEGTN